MRRSSSIRASTERASFSLGSTRDSIAWTMADSVMEENLALYMVWGRREGGEREGGREGGWEGGRGGEGRVGERGKEGGRGEGGRNRKQHQMTSEAPTCAP